MTVCATPGATLDIVPQNLEVNVRQVAHHLAALALVLSATSTSAVTYVVPSDASLIRSVDTIIFAETISTYVEESKGFVSTVVILRIDDVLRGSVTRGEQLELRLPGGATEHFLTIAPGTPPFRPGDRALLFLRRTAEGSYAIADVGLGAFFFETDDTGRHVLVRCGCERMER